MSSNGMNVSELAVLPPVLVVTTTSMTATTTNPDNDRDSGNVHITGNDNDDSDHNEDDDDHDDDDVWYDSGPAATTTTMVGTTTKNTSHLRTYVAGEDGGRLAEAARAFGLQHARQPQRPVRRHQRHNGRGGGGGVHDDDDDPDADSIPATKTTTTKGRWYLPSSTTKPSGTVALQQSMRRIVRYHTGTEDARMRAIYMARHDDDSVSEAATAEEYSRLLHRSSPSLSSSLLVKRRSSFPKNYGSLAVVDGNDDAALLEEEGQGPFSPCQDYEQVNKNGWGESSMDSDDRTGEEDANDQQPHDTSSPAHDVPVGADLTAAVLGMIKAMVGPAILYLPHGFATAGYAVALPVLLLCTVMFLYSAHSLLQAWNYEQSRDRKAVAERDALLDAQSDALPLSEEHHCTRMPPMAPMPLSYPELAYRAFGRRGEWIVETGIALMQSGVCLTYLIFVPQNLHSAFQSLTNGRYPNVSPNVWLAVMVVAQIPLSWIRDIRHLTPTNLLANVCILYGLSVFLAYSIGQVVTTWPVTSVDGDSAGKNVTLSVVDVQAQEWIVIEDLHHAGPWQHLWQHLIHLRLFYQDWFLFIGTSVLLFEGSITLLIPLQEAVAREEQRIQFPTVYNRVILSIIAFYGFFGITCWMAFGDDVNTVLTTSLPGSLATSVELAYSLAVMLTFPLQNFPALEIASRAVSTLLDDRHRPTLYETSTAMTSQEQQQQKDAQFARRRNMTSTIIVLLLAAVAVGTMNSLDKVVSLMGSLLGCPIAFCFPPLIHSQLLGPHHVMPWRLWMNRVVAMAGIGSMILASVATLITWND